MFNLETNQLSPQISFFNRSGVYQLEVEQFLPVTIEVAWNFFSSPKNLSKITPPNMGFDITSECGDTMYRGQIITYKIGILPGIKGNWVTEITELHKPNLFIDEQRVGPYSIWHHEHHFRTIDNGVIMKDIVSYKVPLGFIGRFLHSVYIKKQLKSIFQFRINTLEKMRIK